MNAKYVPKTMVWLPETYIHRIKTMISGDVHLNQCVKLKLISFIEKSHSTLSRSAVRQCQRIHPIARC